MKSSRNKNSALDRRLRELEEESRRLRSQYKSLHKNLKRGGGDAPGSSTATERNDPKPDRMEPHEDSAPYAGGYAATHESSNSAGHASAGPRNRVHGDQRFASYFATGSFKPLTPIGQDRSIQRNKAIFMVVIVLILGYIIYYALIRQSS